MGARLGTIALAAASLLACAPEGPTALVVGTLLPDEECAVSGDSVQLLKGTYDTAPGFQNQCASSYNMSLLVNSYLIRRGSPLGSPPPVRAEPNVLQLERAEVTLLQVDDTLFPFADTTLLNPFSVTTHATIPPSEFEDPGVGVALVEVIPSRYAGDTRLRALGNSHGTLVAAVSLFGTTTGGVEIELSEYRFPIELCDGCYTLCRTDLTPDDLEALTDGVCADNAGADGRPCIQSRCR